MADDNRKVEGEKKKKKDDEAPAPEIVLKVDMHCQACARKVAGALRGFEGVEEVNADSKAGKVVVKVEAAEAVADPLKLCQRILKKTGRRAEVISPASKLPPESKPEKNKGPPEKDNRDQAPSTVTILLKMGMHCEACAQALQKRVGKIKGVESMVADFTTEKLTVKGVLEGEKLVNEVYKRTGKLATMVKADKEKAEKPDEKKSATEDESKEEDDKKNEAAKKSDTSPPKYYMDHAYYYHAPQLFSDENPNACSVM